MTDSKILNSAELDELMTAEKKESLFLGTRLCKKFKHTLDSDEEDDEEKAEKYNVLNPDDFEGHEEATIDHDGDIKITPFNMKEELEEGYFDKDGTYIFQKDDDIKDQWLDDIDWVKVKKIDGKNIKKRQLSESDSDDLPELDVIGHYKKMLVLMSSGETVQKAICRLGGSKTSKKSKNSRRNETNLTDAEKEEVQKNKEKLQELTGLASELLQNGDTDIYQITFERLTFLVKTKESAKSSLYEANDDMFADDFDAKAKTETTTEKPSLESEVTWEFKWEDKDGSPVYGPHTTSEMLNWTQEGYFAEGVYVREVGKTDSKFYNSKRMDFELYL